MLGLVVTLVAALSNYEEPLAKSLMSLNVASLCPPATLQNWSCSRCNVSTFPAPAEDLSVIVADKALGMENLVSG